MAINKFYTCPENCGLLGLSTLSASQNCGLIENSFPSQIIGFVFLSQKNNLGATNPFPATNDAAGWAAVLDNTDTTGAKAKYIRVVGGMPTPEAKNRIGAKGVEYPVYRTYKPTGIVQNMSSENFEFLRNLMCGAFTGYIWLVTEDFVFGGITAETAITLFSLTADIPLDASPDSFIEGNIAATFRAKNFPSRAANVSFQ